ncbi:MAG: hypothetical protein ACXAB7_21895 [Candidatus Kariarchaeaceae archaeon]|jgi:hypothetical protein
MEQLSSRDVETLLSDFLSLKDFLVEGTYFRFKGLDQTFLITFTKLSIFPSLTSVQVIGIPIIKGDGKELTLLPGIFECIRESFPSHHISQKEANTVTRGHRVSLPVQLKYTGILVLTDKYGSKIALGTCNQNTFTPLVDLGWYLREQSSFLLR